MLTTWIPLLSLLAPSSDWGSFRGPNGQGVHPSATLPALGEEVAPAWRVELPRGYSSPVLAEGCVLLTAWDGDDAFLVCLDRTTGEERWRRAAPREAGHYGGPNSPVSPTPVTDGEHVVVLFPCFGLLAFDLAGEELWRVETEAFNVPHMMSSSPVLAGGKVIVQADQDTNGYLAAYDVTSGEEVWRTPRPGIIHGYATPSVHAPAEGRAVVILSGAYQLAGYDLESGEKVWWVDGMGWMTKSLPVIADDVVYVANYMGAMSEYGGPRISGTFEEALEQHDEDGDGKISLEEFGGDDPSTKMFWFLLDLDEDNLLGEYDWDHSARRGQARGGVFAVRLGGEGEVTESHVQWSFEDRRSLPDVPSPIVVGDHLFLLKDGGILTALDRSTGEVAIRERVGEPDSYFASPVVASDKMLLTGRSGRLTVIDAAAEWEIHAVLELQEDTWATPALADGEVFVRTEEALYAFRAAGE